MLVYLVDCVESENTTSPYLLCIFSVIHRFDIKDCDIWFIRFCLDFCKKTIAVGNKSGKTYIFDVNVSDPSQIRSSILTHPKCTSAIRQTALSRDGKVLICVCDDSTIWRWDRDEDFEDDMTSTKA